MRFPKQAWGYARGTMSDDPHRPTEIREEIDDELETVEDDARAEEAERLADMEEAAAAAEEAAGEDE